MYLRKIYAVIFVSFFISGCSLPGIPGQEKIRLTETAFNDEIFARGGRALVLLEAENSVPSRVSMDNYFTFQNDSYGKFTIRIDNRKKKTVHMMLVPGTYTLTDYYLYGYSGGGNYSVSASLSYTDKYKASFTLKPGDVVYLGRVKNSTRLGRATGGFFSPVKHSAATSIQVVNALPELSANFVSLIEEYTGKNIEVRLMEWSENTKKGKTK